MGVPSHDPADLDPVGAPGPDEPWAVGVHSNFRGRWVVNGSSLGIVELGLEPAARARTAIFPIAVKVLGLGLRDPEGLLKTLGVPEHD